MSAVDTVNFSSTRTSIFKRIINIFESIGYARAAAELARMGHYEEARKCMLEREKLSQK